MLWRIRSLNLLALPPILALALGACKSGEASVDPGQGQGQGSEATPVDAWAEYEALETRIAAGEVADKERAAVLDAVREAPDDHSAAYAYARAAVAGRVAEGRGLKALKIIKEMRTWCLRSIERDPEFRDMAATRMLGTLYVFAGQHLDEGDSEEGLELLESVVDAHPDSAVAHLRLAEGYVALGDPEPALESLCVARAGTAALTGEEQELLASLIEEIGGADLLPCAQAGEVGEGDAGAGEGGAP